MCMYRDRLAETKLIQKLRHRSKGIEATSVDAGAATTPAASTSEASEAKMLGSVFQATTEVSVVDKELYDLLFFC